MNRLLMRTVTDPSTGRKRIVHIIGALPVGGAETVLCRLLEWSHGSGLESLVLSLKDRGALGDRLARQGVEVMTLGVRHPLNAPAALARLAGLVREVRPDLIVGWMYHGNLFADLTRSLMGGTVPMVWNIRHTPNELAEESFTTRWAIRIGAFRARRAVTIIYNSEPSAERHFELGYPEEGSRVLPNGFDCEQFRPSEEARSTLLTELGVERDTRLVGRIGRFHPVKDYETFLAACSRIVQDHPDVEVVLAGPGIDGQNPLLRSWIAEARLGSHIHLLGPVTQMERLLAGLDLVCSSSLGESFPNVVAEAMACGVPCVVTDVGSSADLVGMTGRVVPPGDSKALSQEMSAILGLMKEERLALGRAARERIRTHFSAEAVFPRYEKIWREALGLEPTST